MARMAGGSCRVPRAQVRTRIVAGMGCLGGRSCSSSGSPTLTRLTFGAAMCTVACLVAFPWQLWVCCLVHTGSWVMCPQPRKWCPCFTPSPIVDQAAVGACSGFARTLSGMCLWKHRVAYFRACLCDVLWRAGEVSVVCCQAHHEVTTRLWNPFHTHYT